MWRKYPQIDLHTTGGAPSATPLSSPHRHSQSCWVTPNTQLGAQVLYDGSCLLWLSLLLLLQNHRLQLLKYLQFPQTPHAYACTQNTLPLLLVLGSFLFMLQDPCMSSLLGSIPGCLRVGFLYQITQTIVHYILNVLICLPCSTVTITHTRQLSSI